MPEQLPIDEIKANFIEALDNHQTLLLSAEPGAGKSTRLPLWLLEPAVQIEGKIYLLQPRRVAVKSIASYLAAQRGEEVGESVGYRLRNETKVSKDTRLEVITEGVLVQIMQNDPEMADTSVIILDEFHERSLQADLAFAIARDIQQGLHEDLTLVLMSATLATETMKQALPDAVLLHSEGRSYPVKVHYQPPANIRYWRDHALSVIKQALNQYQGSLLVFLPGSGDIKYLAQQLSELENETFVICPLYGEMTLKEQQQAIAAPKEGSRKLVLATNIAETSLTIEGIQVVIDSGLEKVAIFDDNTLTNRLVQRQIAKSSAIQRAGRAGRVAQGDCIRLFSEEEFQRRVLQNALPIQQADILPVVIEAARWGGSELHELPLLDLPKQSIENNAWQTLQQLQVVDDKRRLSSHGQLVTKLNCHTRYAHMVIQATQLEQEHQQQGLAYLACLLAAMLEERDVLSHEDAKANSDVRLRLKLVMAKPKEFRHQQILKQANKLAQAAQCQKQSILPFELAGLLLVIAYPERLAKSRQVHGEYLAQNGKGIVVDEQDPISNEDFLVAAVLMQVKHSLRVRLAAPVDIEQLIDWQVVVPSEHNVLSYDEKSSTIIAVKQQRIGDIVLSERSNREQVDGGQLQHLWRQQIERHGLDFLNWQEQDLKLLQRWRWLNQTQELPEFPSADEHALIENIATWLLPYLDNISKKSQLDKLDLSECLLSLLEYQQQQLLNKIAPSYFVGPTGRKCPIRYQQEQNPIVSLPMQEVYGMQMSPTAGTGKQQVNLTLELLSPAQRPIQVTSDLARFWQGSYIAVQKEMKAKYPKHYWPDDPANAVATNKTKKYM